MSGTGVVAEGVEFSDGTVALRWTSAWPTSVVFHDRGITSVEAIHGHGGKTRIVWAADGALQRDFQSLLRIGRDIEARRRNGRTEYALAGFIDEMSTILRRWDV